jgi:hypothetical protein
MLTHPSHTSEEDVFAGGDSVLLQAASSPDVRVGHVRLGVPKDRYPSYNSADYLRCESTNSTMKGTTRQNL